MSPVESRNLKRVALLFFYPFIYLLKIIPRNKRLWLFGNFKGYSDNTKYLFEYVLSLEELNIEAYWATNDRSLFKKLSSQNIKVVYLNSFKGLWLSFRAGVTFMNNGYSDLNRIATIHSFIVNLWHGTPIKKIFFDADLETRFVSFGAFNKPLTYLNEVSTRYLTNKINLFFVSSPFELKRMSQALKIPNSIFRITGTPRMDIIKGELISSKEGVSILESKKYKDGKVVLYAPSWRDSGWERGQILDSMEKLNTLLEEENMYMFIKRHPLTSRNEIDQWGIEESDRLIILEERFDINEMYGYVDILITDFSSLIFDFAILKRPILFFITDLDKYSNDRGFYDDIVELSGGKIAQDWKNLRKALKEVSHKEHHQFIVHPHYEYLLNKPHSNVRASILEHVLKETGNA